MVSSVSLTSSSSSFCTLSSVSALTQSSVSLMPGVFLRSSLRSDCTTATTSSASLSAASGTLSLMMASSCLRSGKSMYRCKQRRLSASDISRALFEVRITRGMCFAVRVPSSGTEIWKSESNSSRNASNSASALSISSTSSTHCFFPRDSIHRLGETLGAGQNLTDLVLQDLRVQQLLGVLPLVERLAFIESFVALQTNQVVTQRGGEHLGEVSLADAGRPFHQDRLLERACEVYDGRDSPARDIIVCGESFDDFVDR